jgi:hypothetical protein
MKLSTMVNSGFLLNSSTDKNIPGKPVAAKIPNDEKAMAELQHELEIMARVKKKCNTNKFTECRKYTKVSESG